MSEEKLPLSPYVPDASKDMAYYYIDEHNLCLTHSWDNGKPDSIGRTMITYEIYDDPKLIEGIVNLWQYRADFNDKMVGMRHPDIHDAKGRYAKGYWHNRMSRDHYNYTLIALKLWEKRTGKRHPKLEEIIKETPFGIRRMARWTLGLILWSKSLVGNKFALWIFLMSELFMVNLIYVPIWKLGMKLAKWDEEVDQEDWVKTLLQDQPKWKQRIDKIIYPSYAISFSAKQLYVTPDSFPKMKKALQKSLLKMVGKTNYVQQMYLGKKDIPRDKVEAFKTMRGGRWSGYLHGRSDRNMYVFPKGKYTANLQDVDLVRHLYNETQID